MNAIVNVHKDDVLNLVIVPALALHPIALSERPECQYVLSTGGIDSDHEIKLWNLTSGVCESVLRGHQIAVTALLVLKDGTGTIASGDDDGFIRLWIPDMNTETETAIATTDRSGTNNSINSSTSGSTSASGGLEDRGRSGAPVTDVCPYKCVGALKCHEFGIFAMAELANGQLATVSNEGDIFLWDARRAVAEHMQMVSSYRVGIIKGDAAGSNIWCLGVLGDGKTIVAGDAYHLKMKSSSGDGSCNNSDLSISLEGHIGAVRSMCVLADGLSIVSGDEEGSILLWRP
jgi:WD40 repeat protein